MLLWGPPGTGKSLSAKLAAKKLGYALLAVSWGNILGSSSPDRALSKILDTADHLGGCVLFADDFDKGFSGWDSNADGGIARRLSQKLLTWMAEHETEVLMLATVNRLSALHNSDMN
jgi:SpoVK/Ycf46/Vps4 family AAA+-type ATPase